MTHNKLASWGHGLEIHFPTIPLPNILQCSLVSLFSPSLFNLTCAFLQCSPKILAKQVRDHLWPIGKQNVPEVHFPGGSGVRDMAPPSLGNLGASSLKSDSLILRPTLSKSAIVIFVALGKFYWLPPDKENTFYHPIMYTSVLFIPVFA